MVDLSAASSAAPFQALYLRHITTSSITTGPVSGATHITDVAGSVLYVATRQFRMHGARGVDV